MHTVGKSQLHSLNLLMEGVSAIFFSKLKAFQDVQSHKHRNAMAIRRNLPHIVATVVNMDWLHPLSPVIR